MKEIYIYCDGGFGNRFNGLVSGLSLAKTCNLVPKIIWPSNNWCGASFHEIFDSDHKIITKQLKQFSDSVNLFQFVMHEDQCKFAVSYKNPHEFRTIDQFKSNVDSDYKNVFYYTSLIPSFIPVDVIKEVVSELEFNKSIWASVNSFIEPLGNEYYGVHLRKTDYLGGTIDENKLIKYICDNQQSKFFVCSDDRATEIKFDALNNVYVRPKKEYAEKMVDGQWNDVTIDSSGRVNPFNVNRNSGSVIEAIIDLLILSKSVIIRTSDSTFLNSAILIGEVNASKRL